MVVKVRKYFFLKNKLILLQKKPRMIFQILESVIFKGKSLTTYLCFALVTSDW